MIEDDVLVFDCVTHPFNFDPSNALGKAGELFNNHLYVFRQVLTPESEPKLSEEEFLKEWGTDEISRMVFEESDTDMLVTMPLPLTDLFPDGSLGRLLAQLWLPVSHGDQPCDPDHVQDKHHQRIDAHSQNP